MSIDIAPYLVGVEEAIARATRGSSFITPDNWNLLTTWGLWVFKSKSENLQYYRKDDAAAVNRHTSNLIHKMVEGSMKLCAHGGRPENVHEFIEI